MSTEQIDATVNEETQELSVFEKNIDGYITQINSLMDTMPIILNILASNTIMHIDKFRDFIKQQGLDTPKKGEASQFPIELYGRYERLNSNAEKAIKAFELYPCNMVVSFVSMYDAFLGNVIKAIYATMPEKLNECNRDIPINEILQFESIEEAKERVIEKEAESVIRSSHSEQLDWFKKRLGTSFKEFDSYNKFIEITERRNLFVHTNGVVSRQYLNICRENKVKDSSKIKVGDTLSVTPEYIQNCYNVLFEVGVKLGIVVWRKLKKGDEEADCYLNTICYNLLKQERYELAKIMLNFATETLKNIATDEIRRMLIINKALAYYLAGDKQTCNSIISKEDWSACAVKFQLAIAVLKEDYKLAASKMETEKSDIDKIAYREWPLFKNFRNSEEFKSEYQKLFGHGFDYTEPQKENFNEILHYAMDIQNKVKNIVDKDLEENHEGKQIDGSLVVE